MSSGCVFRECYWSSEVLKRLFFMVDTNFIQRRTGTKRGKFDSYEHLLVYRPIKVSKNLFVTKVPTSP